MAGASSEYTAMKARLAELKRSEATIARRLALSSGLASDRVEWSRVLRRLSNDIPRDVWLRSLATSDAEAGPDGTPATREKRVRMLGSALANGAVASFIRTLEGSGYLDDVTLSYTQKRDFDTMTVFDFEVTARLKKPAEADYGG
jgi:Tfp pilus assembly protein PilN